MNNMNLYKNFIEKIPDAKAYCIQAEKKENIDESDGMHVVFSLIIYPFVKEQMEQGNDDTIKQIFDFIETIENGDNGDYKCIIEQSLIEYLLAEDRKLVNKYGYIYGDSTKKAIYEINKYVA